MRAHRIDNGTGATNVQSRTLIFSCLRYTFRQDILVAARRKPSIIHGRKLSFSPHYSAHTLKQRLAFSMTMDQARANGIEFFLMYPATLKIKSKAGAVEVFQSTSKAEEYITLLLRGSPGTGCDDTDI